MGLCVWEYCADLGVQECMIGVVFAEEAEAKTFYKKVTGRKAEKCRSSLPIRSHLADDSLQQNLPLHPQESLQRTAKLINR